MTRLQKKCLVAAAGAHFLAVVAVLCSGFITSSPKVDDHQILEAIPNKTIDALLNSGVRAAQLPKPTPVVQPQPQPQPEPPKPEVKPIAPPQPADAVKPPEPTEPDNPAPERNIIKPKPQPHRVEVNLKEVVRNKNTETDHHEAEEKAEEKAAQRARAARIRALQTAARNIKNSAASPTTVDLPGDSSVAYANYATIVLSVYTDAWTLPSDSDSDDAIVKVSVTIANDGRVLNAHIVGRSGDKSVDNSVQRTLDRVTEIAPFPDGATEKERTYIIYFNLKAKRQMLG